MDIENLSIYQWSIIILSGLLIGAAKTGIPGLGTLSVPLMAMAVGARQSVGLVLPMLIFADIFAVIYHRYHANWHHIGSLMPWTLPGIAAGYFLMGKISDSQLKPVIGAIILVMLGVKIWQQKSKNSSTAGPEEGICSDKFRMFKACFFGFTAGLTTMMANAAGPVLVLYLVSMRLDKIRFVGTAAWFFFIVNWIKVPLNSRLDLINAQTLSVNLCVFPVIAAGALTGIVVLKRIPQKAFIIIAELLAAAAAVKLLLPSALFS